MQVTLKGPCPIYFWFSTRERGFAAPAWWRGTETLINQSDLVFKAGSRTLFYSPDTDMPRPWPTLFPRGLTAQFLLLVPLTLRCRGQVCQAPWQMPITKGAGVKCVKLFGRCPITKLRTMKLWLPHSVMKLFLRSPEYSLALWWYPLVKCTGAPVSNLPGFTGIIIHIVV